ncbi:type IV pilus twitching motility protein PilT [Chloroflexota bacterium]
MVNSILAHVKAVCNTNIEDMLRLARERGASDLHLTVPYPPSLRIHGMITPIEDRQSLMSDDVKRIFENITTESQRETFYQRLELDFMYQIHDIARFRVNACMQQGSVSISFRIIPLHVPTVDELGLPQVCKTLAMKHHGLVLVTGPTGVGKTTTMACMIKHINEHCSRKIVTIEDPVEYVHSIGQAMIVQRDLGNDTRSFQDALKHALRQDPDVILVGEMRDLETMSTAISAAETGHLVVSTLHTIGASDTIERIIDAFPAQQQQQIRLQLSLVLEGVLSQVLLPRSGDVGRVAAFEVMLGTTAIRNLIRESKTHQINTVLELGSNGGMHSLAQDIKQLAREGRVIISEELARMYGLPEEFINTV